VRLHLIRGWDRRTSSLWSLVSSSGRLLVVWFISEFGVRWCVEKRVERGRLEILKRKMYYQDQINSMRACVEMFDSIGYRGHPATLLARLDHSDWRRDNRSAANFKVGRSVARPNGKFPFYHPEGTDVEGFPFILRYDSLDSRQGDEPEVNSALEAFHERGGQGSTP